jgi:hypothetical protein
MPFSVTCFFPSGVLMVPSLPVTPSPAGEPEVVVSGGHWTRQEPVQALVPESLVSLVKN